MLTHASLFLFVSSFLHAGWNSYLKTQPHKQNFLFCALFFAALLSWTLAVFIDSALLSFFHTPALLMSFLSGIFEGCYFATLTLALRDAPLAISYSLMRSFSMILSWTLSLIFFHERLTIPMLLGVVVILMGLMLPLIHQNNLKNKSDHHHKLFWSYLCGLCIVGYNLTYHQAMQQGAPPITLFALSLSIALPFLGIMLQQEYRSLNKMTHTLIHCLKLQLFPIITVSGIIVCSFVFFLYGLRVTAPALALSIRNSSIAFALIFSYLLGEKLAKHEKIALVFIIFGVGLISYFGLL